MPQRTFQWGWGIKEKRIQISVFELVEVITILLTGETGTVFVDTFEFTVAHDLCIGIVDLQ